MSGSERELEVANITSEQDEINSLTRGTQCAVELVETIHKLYKLYKCGALTETEFNTAKERVLSADTTFFTYSESLGISTSGRYYKRRKRRKCSLGSKGGNSNNSSKGSIICEIQSKNKSRGTRSFTTSSSSSSSSSSSTLSDFMIAPRAKVWFPLDEISNLDNIGIAGRVAAPALSHLMISDKEQAKFTTNISTYELPISPTGGRRYGTFQSPWHVRICGGKEKEQQQQTKKKKEEVPLRSSYDVHVEYFNSRGGHSDKFSDVKLKENELRPSYFLHKRQNSCTQFSGFTTSQSDIDFGNTTQIIDDKNIKNPTILSTLSSTHSNLEMCLNWYWIDMIGRDSSCIKYNNTLRHLTRKFHISESFLIDRDHLLVLPQICTSPEFPSQFLMCFRVATPHISLDDDSVQELTNRWIIIVDLNQKFVLTIHRMDVISMANMRYYWKSLMEGNDISFQEFLFKLLVEAVSTYKRSLDVHSDLLELCESKLFVLENNDGRYSSPHIHKNNKGGIGGGGEEEEERQRHISYEKILSHFSNSSHSPFLQQLLNKTNKKNMDKGVVNTFLYHLHRRTNVQYRMLTITQTVLAESFTKLRLCSKEHANQMCAQCIELIDRALEVRDEAKTLLHMHISLQSFRSNELMAVLTKFSVFFTPCSFLATVYGMNFPRIPELHFAYGYAYYWITCLGMCILTYVYMKSRGLLQ